MHKNLLKFGCAVFELYEQTGWQKTNRQTHKQTDWLQYFAPLMGQSKNIANIHRNYIHFGIVHTIKEVYPEQSDHHGAADRASVPRHQLPVWSVSCQTSQPTRAGWQSWHPTQQHAEKVTYMINGKVVILEIITHIQKQSDTMSTNYHHLKCRYSWTHYFFIKQKLGS